MIRLQIRCIDQNVHDMTLCDSSCVPALQTACFLDPVATLNIRVKIELNSVLVKTSISIF